jgi:type II secretory ATPase GspE/PulE/Tfp pilus assembly ATPase PilB-like protein
MKLNFISKIINYGLWQGATSLYIELSSEGLEVDYHEASADDLLLRQSACDKFMTELNSLTNTQKLESGANIYFPLQTAINTRTVSLTSIAGENHKYLLQVIEPETTAWKLSNLGMDSNILRNLKKHLQANKAKGLIAVSSKDKGDKEKTLEAIAHELKKLNRDIMSIGKLDKDIIYLDKNEKYLKNIDEHDLISLLNKHSDDVIITSSEDDNIIKALIKYSLNSNKLIILAINSQSSHDAYNKLQEHINDKGLSKNINFILHQETFKRQCPHCLDKTEHSSYEAKSLDDFSFHYNLGDIKNNSYSSNGCNKCNYKSYNGKTLAFEVLSFRYPHLNTPSLIDDAFKKQSLGIISANDLLRLSRI